MPVGKDGIRIISPNQVERAVSDWVSQILAEKRKTGSFGSVSVELSIKCGEPEMIRFSDNTTIKVEK